MMQKKLYGAYKEIDQIKYSTHISTGSGGSKHSGTGACYGTCDGLYTDDGNFVESGGGACGWHRDYCEVVEGLYNGGDCSLSLIKAITQTQHQNCN